MILGNSAIGGTGLGNFNDPFYNYVTLLLTGANGSNATSNNTFIDSSQYSQTVTRNGDTTQGSFTPYNGNYYSNYFDGSGDSLTYTGGSSLNFGTGDFTIETWAYLTNTGTFSAFLRPDDNGTFPEWGYDFSAGQLKFDARNAAIVATTTTMPTNQWVHLAVSRSGTSLRQFINGTQVGSTTTNSSNFGSTTGTIRVGGSGFSASHSVNGYLSNFRVVNGTALYTGNFTPPSTAPLTAVTSTSLLTCQNNRFIDNSLNNYTITRVGDTRVQAFNPFAFQGLSYAGSINGGSMYFDGNGDWLEIPYNETFNLSTGNWTVECWWYPTVVANQTIVMINYVGGDGYAQARIAPTSGGAFAILSASGPTTWINTTGIGSYTTGQWYHVAYVRNGSTFSLYVNGTLAGSYSSASNLQAGTGVSAIGRTSSSISAFNYTTGYISDVRLTKGVAVYTSSFTLPTQPLQPISGTSLLVRGTNASIFDRKEINNLAAIGDTQLRTDITRYNSTSIFFDGTGDYLYAPWNPGLEFFGGNFTIEFWAYVIGGNTLFCWSTDWHYGMTFNYGGATSNRVGVWASSNGSSWNIFNADGGGNGISTGTITLNTWTHVAWVRNGSSWALYLNGTSAWTGTSSASIISRTDTFRIGGPWPGSGPTPFNGYLDDFRITNGIARYTANFTPPTYSPLGF